MVVSPLKAGPKIQIAFIYLGGNPLCPGCLQKTGCPVPVGQTFRLKSYKQQVTASPGYEILGSYPACLFLVSADIGNPALARKLIERHHGYIVYEFGHALRAPGTNGEYEDSLHLVFRQELQIIPLRLQFPEAVAQQHLVASLVGSVRCLHHEFGIKRAHDIRHDNAYGLGPALHKTPGQAVGRVGKPFAYPEYPVPVFLTDTVHPV